MGLPLEICGQIQLSNPDSRALIASRLEQALRAASASSVERAGETISFQVNLFRPVSNWNILVPFDRGVISVVRADPPMTVTYRASLRRILFIVTFMACGFIGPQLAVAGVSLLEATITSLVAWVWLFGFNVAVASYRFPRWLAKEACGQEPPV